MSRLCHLSLEDLILLFQYLDKQINELGGVPLSSALDPPQHRSWPPATVNDDTGDVNNRKARKLPLDDLPELVQYLDNLISKLYKRLNSEVKVELNPLVDYYSQLDINNLCELDEFNESKEISGKRKLEDCDPDISIF